MKRAVIYARVSTDEQAEHGYSLSSQIEACIEYAKQHDFEVVATFQDSYSGAKLNRPELEKVRQLIEEKKTDVLIIYSSDRLTRNLAHLLILREQLKQSGVELHYVRRGKTEDTPEARFSDNIEGVFNEYWRERIIESSRRGKLKKAKGGQWVGHKIPFGYLKEGKGNDARLRPNPDLAPLVRRMFAMYLGCDGNKRHSINQIAKTFTCEGIPTPHGAPFWNPTSIRYLLINRTYTGEVSYAGHIARIPELSMIPHEWLDAVQERIEKNKAESRRNTKNHYLMANRLQCVCGLKMHSVKRTPRAAVYRCRRYRTSYAPHPEGEHKTIQMNILDPLIWNTLVDELEENKLRGGLIERNRRVLAELEPKRRQLETTQNLIGREEQRIKTLMQKFADETDETIIDAQRTAIKDASRRKNSLTIEFNRLKMEIARGGMPAAETTQIAELARTIRAKLLHGQNLSPKQKREVIEILDVRGQLVRKGNKLYVSMNYALDLNARLIEIKCSS